MEEVRSVQMTGGSTLTISLPKDWADRSGLRKGSRVVISEKDDGTIGIYPMDTKPQDQRVKTLPLEGDLSLLARKIIASYIMGFDTIVLKSDRIDSQHRTKAFELAEDLMGLEVVREDSKSIEIKQMLDPRQLTIASALSRLALLAESMMQDLSRAISEGDGVVLRDLITRESHADRIHWFIVRQINYAILDHRFARSVELDIRLATCYLGAARNIERICDHIENVARYMMELGPGSLPTSLIDLAKSCSDIFSRAMRSFVRKDIKAAEMILTEVDQHKEQYAMSAFSDVSKAPTRRGPVIPMLMAESFHRIISYSQDIAEMTVDALLSA